MNKSSISSLSNPLIKQARALRQKKARLESGLFLVEGIHHIGEAVDAGWGVDFVYYAPNLLTSKFANELILRLASNVQPVSEEVIRSLTDKDNPQGIVAVVRQKTTSISSLPFQNISVALVSPQDPGNVGTILRTMDAIGVGALFLLEGGVELFHPNLIRSSMGTIFWKTVIQTSFDEFLYWSRTENVQLIGSSARADVDYRTLVPTSPWVLVLGNEQKGLSPEHLKACDVSVSLPMHGRVSSLNLAVAAGVLLYQLKQ
jgi:TrmH family RNA methyltransferase